MGGLMASFSDVGTPTMVGSDVIEYFSPSTNSQTKI